LHSCECWLLLAILAVICILLIVVNDLRLCCSDVNVGVSACLEDFLTALSGCVTNYPSYDNYVQTASALMRLQDVYDLDTTYIASGLVGSATVSSPSMTGN